MVTVMDGNHPGVESGERRQVPVSIRGTFEARPRGGVINRPQRVEVRYGRPIDVKDYGVRQKAQLMEEVREQMLELRGMSI